MSDDPMNLKIDARLVRLGRDLEAKAGDLLIVAGGVCLGVYTGEMAARHKAVAVAGLKAAKRDIAKQRAEAGRKGGQAKAADAAREPKGVKHPAGKVGQKVEARRTNLLDVLETLGGKASAADFKRHGAGRDNDPYSYDTALHTLEREGCIRRSGSERKRTYELVKRPGAQPNGAAA
jgi:hypothetical protein